MHNGKNGNVICPWNVSNEITYGIKLVLAIVDKHLKDIIVRLFGLLMPYCKGVRHDWYTLYLVYLGILIIIPHKILSLVQTFNTERCKEIKKKLNYTVIFSSYLLISFRILNLSNAYAVWL